MAAVSSTIILSTTGAASRSWPNASVSANGILPKVCRQKARRLPAESKQNRDKHQNTRTQKKEKEEYSSSFSKEIGVSDFELVREKAHANADIIRNYPKLDLSDAWNAFNSRHYGETHTVNDWTRLWKGWCQRRANMSGIPPSKRHVHTWKCRHVLEALGRDEETAQADEKACELADKLNKEKS